MRPKWPKKVSHVLAEIKDKSGTVVGHIINEREFSAQEELDRRITMGLFRKSIEESNVAYRTPIVESNKNET